MATNPGYKGKVTIGAVTIAELNKFSVPYGTNRIIPKPVFGATFDEFEYGAAEGGNPEFSGWFSDDDTTGQDLIRAAYEDKTTLANLRFYYGTGVTDFKHLYPGAVCMVEELNVGDADASGLIPVTAKLKVTGGYFTKANACYDGIDVSFGHVAGANNDTVTKTGGTSFVGLGFLAGQKLVIQGSTSNDGTSWTIYNVAANVLTLSDDTIVTEIAGDTVALIGFTPPV